MDSKDSVRYYALRGIICILIPLLIYFIVAKGYGVYEVYINDIVVGYVENKDEAKEAFNDLKKDINNRFNNVDMSKEKLTYKKIKDSDVKLSNLVEVKNTIRSNLNKNVNVIKLLIEDNYIGYVANKEEGQKVLEKVAEYYIDENKIDRDSLISVEVNTNLKCIEEKTNISNTISIDDIVAKVITLNKQSNDPLVEVEIQSKNKEFIEIVPSTIINSTNDLYIGDSKITKGTSGQKEVINEVTFINDKKVDVKKVEEKVLVPTKDTIIQQGTKNPISAGVTFLAKPSRGSISSGYGSRWGGTHHGIDIVGNIGDPIKSALGGIVKEIGYSNVYGNMIILNHGNGIETVYGHCSKIIVKSGETVKKGDIIGKIGSTGRSTGPHLHFELRVNGRAIDPSKYIK
ncbi:metalloendopeptidase [Clostridium polyendosporum]|uniref:Metalloendopeptidase n=1 Tax=Clostridium polyendosporum TaxID=69208 RepID=A0A919VLU5_9CLOT|nr:M23 family metallopeptidase [Clostridium polyendosporum]GIM28938.1 metalloendopeptidase [Clostridium polyendosporum]